MDGEKTSSLTQPICPALVWHALPDINWCGFYLYDGNELVVGPFQGKPACVRIALGRGVCGTAAQARAIQIVDDVDAFDEHIACDAASRSEIVVPLIGRNGALIGVWDVDSQRQAATVNGGRRLSRIGIFQQPAIRSGRIQTQTTWAGPSHCANQVLSRPCSAAVGEERCGTAS